MSELGASASQAGDGDPMDTNVLLQLLFQYYCRFGRSAQLLSMSSEEDTLDGAGFAKFCRVRAAA